MMIFLKLLLISSGLMFIPETVSIRNESSLCYQPSKYIKPIHYDIKHILCIDGYIFYGEYNISISILNKTRHIFLQSEKLSIKDIVLFTNVKRYNEHDKNTIYKPMYNIKEDTIDILFMDELLPGNYILNIKYHGIADEVFRIYDVKGKITWVVDIHFHIICTKQRFSCWDEQNSLLEATFNICIRCSQCTTLSNMPLQNKERNEYKMLWTHFATTSAMSPYLITMIVSNFLSRIDYDNQNTEMWCRNEYELHMKFAINFAENITLLLKNKWNLRSNITLKVTHVAIPNFYDDGIIDYGLVLYKETDIIYDKKLYLISHKIEIAQLVGRKVIQEWFNTLLNGLFVSDFWIKKGFSILFTTYVVNMSYPDSRIGNLFIVQNQHYSFNLDSYLWNWYYYMGKSTLKVNRPLEIPNSIRGYYRVNYDDENWERISNYLNSVNYTKIHVLNRAQIIDDAFHLMIAGQINCHIFWDLIKYLHREKDYVAWYPMFKAMEYMYGTFPWKEMVGNVTSRVTYVLHEILKEIKYDEIDDIDEHRICLRQEAARWACFLGDYDCMKAANNKLQQHLQDPTELKLLPWWKEWTYCYGLMITTNIETWRLVYSIGYGIEYDNEFDPKFIEYLACPEDANMIENYLKIKAIKKREIQYLLPSFLHIITKHAKNRTTLQYILNNLLDIKPKHVNIAAAFIIIINNVYSVNQTQEITRSVKYLKKNLHIIVDLKEKDFIRQSFGKLESKISIRKNQIETQRRYFNSIFYW